jgi:hypothetical protein
MALEIAGWLVLLLFIAFTAGLCRVCESIVIAVEDRRQR